MLLCTQTSVAVQYFGWEEGIRLLAEAGFDALDVSLFDMTKDESIWNGDTYKEHAAFVRAIAERNGVFFHQAHAPFPSSLLKEGYTEDIFKKIVRSIEVAALLGVKIIVVHPMQELPYHYNKQVLFEENMEFYQKLMPICEKFDIKVATENMWQYDDKRKVIIESTCGSPEEFNQYVDTIHNEHLVACLDLGHCGLIGEDAADMIRKLGHDRLQALHVHDNDHLNDTHTAPYLGKMDWESITQALADIDYAGVFTFEADNFYSPFPKEFFAQNAKFLHDIGRLLIEKIEAKKQ